MFQTLLTDRFKLQFHRVTKEVAAYVLSVDPSGSKLTLGDPRDAFDIPMKTGDRPGETIGASVQMTNLRWRLSMQLNAPVVDERFRLRPLENLASIFKLPVRDRHHHRPHRREPHREPAPIMLDQDSEESLHVDPITTLRYD